MSKIDQLINQLCPDGVEYRTLGSLEDAGLITLGRGKVISKKDIQNNPGDYPIYSSSATNNGLLGSYGDYMFEEELITWSIDGGGKFFYRPASRYSVTNVCGWLRVNDGQINTKYLYHALLGEWQMKVFDYVHKAHPSTIRKEYAVPVPPIEVQSEIAHILDNFTELTAELTAELAFRKRQFDYYMDMMLSFEEDVPVCKIGEVCTIKGRIGFRGYTQKDFVYAGQGAISLSPGNIVDNHLLFENCKYITWEKYYESPEIMLSEGDVVLCKTGSTVGKVAVVDDLPEKTTLNPQLVVLKNIRCNNRYLFYLLTKNEIQAKIKALAGIGSVPNISQKSISEIEIPVPDIGRQAFIVDILDRFDLLCNDASNGLPAEINARNKQYEFYRDRLLTFDELKVA